MCQVFNAYERSDVTAETNKVVLNKRPARVHTVRQTSFMRSVKVSGRVLMAATLKLASLKLSINRV